MTQIPHVLPGGTGKSDGPVDNSRPSGDRARSANMFDVARLAGVSHQTVSRVLNKSPNVRDSTRGRVEEAMRQLRYRPSSAARSLVTRRSKTIGLITTGPPDYGPSSTAFGFNDAARRAGFNVSISSMLDVQVESVQASVDVLLAQSVEAIVLIAAHRGALEAIQGIELGVPLVAVESSGRSGFHSVSINQYQGAYEATMHLANLGHRDIAHVAGPATSTDATERERGWRMAMSELGLVARAPLAGDWSASSGHAIGLALAASMDFTAVFVANDQMALGLLHALRSKGIEVPRDVSLIGFDDIPEAEFFSPPFTTVRQDFEELGRAVMTAVLDLIAGVESSTTAQPVPILIERESCAAPRTI